VPKKKLIHFQENLTFPHLFQVRFHELGTDHPLRTKWKDEFFQNDHPLVIELGCGKGEYTVGFAGKIPGKNFIGIDLKGARLWRGCKTVEEKGMKNVAFIRSRVDHIERFFGPGEVAEIWITFPDPQPVKDRKRLTSPMFLERYRQVLEPKGIIHLKTDDSNLYFYTLSIIQADHHRLLYSTEDLYQSGIQEEAASIQTFYEKMWLEKGKKIFYLRFELGGKK
jgi:tRNA (guanine-N7-)-methyltransferase